MDTVTKFILPGVLLLLTIIFGFWLSQAGKPYNGILFNLHKLLALGAVILIALEFFHARSLLPQQPLLIPGVIAVAACVAVLFATGAFLSAEKFDHAVMLTIHRIALVLVVVAVALTIFLFSQMPA